MDSSLFSNSRATSLSPMSSSQSLVHWFWLARKRGWHFRISTSHFWHPPSLFRYILSVNCLEFGSKPRTTSWPYTSSYCNFQRWLSQAFADWLWAETLYGQHPKNEQDRSKVIWDLHSDLFPQIIWVCLRLLIIFLINMDMLEFITRFPQKFGVTRCHHNPRFSKKLEPWRRLRDPAWAGLMPEFPGDFPGDFGFTEISLWLNGISTRI